MLSIYLRIVDDISYWRSLPASKIESEGEPEGFFKIEDADGNYFGYYHSGCLGEDEEGLYLVFHWAYLLLQVLEKLFTSNYVAVTDIETPSTWLEFHRKDSDVQLKVVKASGSGVLVVDKLVVDEEMELFQVTPFRLLVREVDTKVTKLLQDLVDLNRGFESTKRYQKMNELLTLIRAANNS